MPEIFVYGTLKDPKFRESLLGRKITAYPAALSDFTKVELEIEGEKYPALKSKDKSKVFGFTITVSDDELKKLDNYETEAYKRIDVRLDNGKNVQTYICVD